MSTTNTPAKAGLAGLELQHEVEQFLFHEAELLDDRRIEEWIALMSDDVRYVMPIRTNRSDREMSLEYGTTTNGLAYFDESKASLLFRLRKLNSGQAWAESPPSRTRHVVSNVRVTPGDTPHELNVKSVFVLYRSRLERQVDLFAGERIDVLRRNGATQFGFQIASRRILLDQATLMAANLSIFF